MTTNFQGGDRPQGLRISERVLQQIRTTVGTLQAETGGMLGGNPTTGVVTHFHFDRSAARSGATYSPNVDELNDVLQREWNPAGVRLAGFVHSHPAAFRAPSGGDEIYADRILKAIPDLERLYLPIVLSEADNGEFQFLPHIARRSGDLLVIERADLVVEREEPEVDRHREPRVEVHQDEPDRTFDRVVETYDLERLRRSRVVAIGCGGAAEFLELLARAGVGEFVLIDPDVVSLTNIATQQVYRRDVDRFKVEAIAERVRDINPDAIVKPLWVSSDRLSDDDFESLLSKAFVASGAPRAVVLCGMTDSFPAQARVNRLALHFAAPSLCAQVYGHGRGAEVTFTHPDTTPACHRCALRSRYEAYLGGGFRNDTTSAGTPVGATSRLNALKFWVAMALLHHGTAHPRWGRTLSRIGNRNLVQIRMDPDIDMPSLRRALRGADPERVFFDETVWLPQLPDNPAHGFSTCPECRGLGHLRAVAGSFRNTRDMERYRQS